MNLYIDYSEFELTCWNTDGKGTNVAIPLTEEQAKKICDIIGLLGFAEEKTGQGTSPLSGSRGRQPLPPEGMKNCLCSTLIKRRELR